MARPRLTYTRRRVRLDGFVPEGIDPKDDELLALLDGLPPRTKFPTVWMMLKMGKALELAVQTGNTEEAVEFAQDLISAFVVEEDPLRPLATSPKSKIDLGEGDMEAELLTAKNDEPIFNRQ